MIVLASRGGKRVRLDRGVFTWIDAAIWRLNELFQTGEFAVIAVADVPQKSRAAIARAQVVER